MRKGQVALEYMAIIGLALLVSTPLIIEAQTSSQDLRDSFQDALAKRSLNSMEEAASMVNSQGPPAKMSFRVRLPDGVQSTNVTDNYLYIERDVGAGSTDFYNSVDFNVTGNIPETSGVHTMVVEAEESYVNITSK